MMQENSYDRYQRQMILPDFGQNAQDKLSRARILVIGAGGLGCPCLIYLAAAGVGHIDIADGDLVSMSNLHRQVLYNSDDIGKNKADIASKRLKAYNPEIVTKHLPFADQALLKTWIPHYDLIIDCTDQFAIRYMINDACVLAKKTCVYAAIFRYQGQLAIFNPHGGIQLRDIFPEMPTHGMSCADAGILGAIAGIMGSLQALEAIKYLLGGKDSLGTQLLQYDFATHQTFKVKIKANNSYKKPNTWDEYIAWNYLPATCDLPSNEYELNGSEFLTMAKDSNVIVIDVRNPEELPSMNHLSNLQIPLSTFAHQIDQLDKSKKILLFCHAGIRSLEALEILVDNYHFEEVYHLKGGLIRWPEIK